MLKQLLVQHSQLNLCLATTNELINAAYRESLQVMVGDQVEFNGNRGIITEITYGNPIKICPYRKDGVLSKQHRLCRDVMELVKI